MTVDYTPWYIFVKDIYFIQLNQKNMDVSIFGATGQQGAAVVREALRKGHKVRAVARSKEKIDSHYGTEVESVEADFNDTQSIINAIDGQDAAFIHLPNPSNIHEPTKWISNLIEALHKTSLSLLVFTTSGPTGSRYPQKQSIVGNSNLAQTLLKLKLPTVVLMPTLYLENLQVPIIVPKLSEGILDYPASKSNKKIMWTSHQDQAKIAVAAFEKPELAGKSYEIATPSAKTGIELANLLTNYVGKPVEFIETTANDFANRVKEAFPDAELSEILAGTYQAIEELENDEMVIDTDQIEKIFEVKLTNIEDHISSWKN
ncbi:MAG: NmrA family NAD(P)-binding protein [Microscillaceae bacterium]|nr:NmrA family NAD(P)-binding protein [Microscillaceae bacterium]